MRACDGKNIDHVQRRTALASLVGAAHGFAVDRHRTGKLDPIGLANAAMNRRKMLERVGVQGTEYPAGCIVAGDCVLQSQEPPQQRFLRASKQGHVRRGRRPRTARQPGR
jgi:hypothetical protein